MRRRPIARARGLRSRYPAVLDHAHVWQDVGGRRFLLAHLYGVTPAKERRVRDYAARHGLTVTIGDPDDDWYGHDPSPLPSRDRTGRPPCAGRAAHPGSPHTHNHEGKAMTDIVETGIEHQAIGAEPILASVVDYDSARWALGVYHCNVDEEATETEYTVHLDAAPTAGGLDYLVDHRVELSLTPTQAVLLAGRLIAAAEHSRQHGPGDPLELWRHRL